MTETVLSGDWQWFKCAKCREPTAFTNGRIEHARRSGTPLHCPFGHENYWKLGKSDNELLQEKLDQERRRRESAEQNIEFHSQMQKRAEHSARAYKGQATKLRNRARAGVCPCCKRSFKQLAAHMANKHPDFSANPDGDLPKDAPPILSIVA